MNRYRKIIMALLLTLVVIVGLTYIVLSLRKASAPPEPSRTPSLEDAPVRLYGRIEPLGREVFLGPQQPRRVIKVFVTEGQKVKQGEVLCELESDVEQEAYRVALAKISEFERRLEIVIDDLLRKEALLPEKAVAEQEVSQKRLEAALLQQQIATARAEAELRRQELEILKLRSPIDGYLYKFDVRLGELLTPQDYQRIIIGKQEKQIRLYIESFWMHRVRVGDRFTVRNGETLRTIGKAIVTTISEYVGARDFRTDDSLERLDTKYAQAILRFEDASDIPLGKIVVCERMDSK